MPFAPNEWQTENKNRTWKRVLNSWSDHTKGDFILIKKKSLRARTHTPDAYSISHQIKYVLQSFVRDTRIYCASAIYICVFLEIRITSIVEYMAAISNRPSFVGCEEFDSYMHTACALCQTNTYVEYETSKWNAKQ